MARLPPNPDQITTLGQWARLLYQYLLSLQSAASDVVTAVPILLARLNSSARASVDGILLFDPVSKVPVYSKDGVFVPVTVTELEITLSEEYNVDGPTLASGNNEVLSFLLPPGTYNFYGFIHVAVTGGGVRQIVCYFAETSDLTTPILSAICKSATFPSGSVSSEQIPVLGTITVAVETSYSLVARTSGTNMVLGIAHGFVGVPNVYAYVEARKVGL